LQYFLKGLFYYMLKLLFRIFIKNYKDTASASVRQAYGVLCGGLGIVFNLVLFAGKFLAGALSGSIAITADAFNNLSDAGSSIITLFGFKMAGQKPDKDHPFGHGRIEYISGLLVSMLILFMAFELLKSSVSKILNPSAPSISPVIIGILAASILVKGYMAYYNYKVGRLINSSTVKAAGTDSLSDMVSTSLVLISSLISHYTDLIIDGYCGVLLGLLIFYAGIQAAKDTIGPLLGQAPDPEYVQQVSDIVMSYDGIIGIHDLIVHNYGPGRVLISLHAEVPSDGDILAMHDMIDLIEHNLRDTLHCSAVIHMDPISVNDKETVHLKLLTAGYLAEIDEQLTMHDFRIVKGPTHTNIIFDVVVPYGFKMSDSQVRAAITERIRQDNPNYYAVIEVDKQFT